MIPQVPDSSLIQISREESQRFSNLTLRSWESAFDRLFEAKLANRYPSAPGEEGKTETPSGKSPIPLPPHQGGTLSRAASWGLEESDNVPRDRDSQDAGVVWQMTGGSEEVSAPPDIVVEDPPPGLDGDVSGVASEIDDVDRLDRRTRDPVDPFSNAEHNVNNVTFFADGDRAELYVRDSAIPDHLADRLASLVRWGNPERGRGPLRLVLNGVRHHYPRDGSQTGDGNRPDPSVVWSRGEK